MALGSIFGGFWDQVGREVGVKLALKSNKMGCQDDVKKSSQIWRREGAARVTQVADLLAP